MTITTFPGVSDQTIISYAILAEKKNETAQIEYKTPIHP